MATRIVLFGIFAWCVSAYNYQTFDYNRPIYLTASIGSYIILNCNIDFPESSPIPFKLVWNHENKTIFSYTNDGVMSSTGSYVGRMHLLNQHQMYDVASINLTSIRETDGGWYECKVYFTNRTPALRNNGTWIYLTVNGGNLLAIPPINQTVVEGEDASLTCLPKDPSLKVFWYKNGTPFEEFPDLYRRTFVGEDGTLTIESTNMADSGEYECEVVFQYGEKQSAKAFLDIQYKARVIFAPAEIQLPFGRSAIIDCNFRANPPLTNLRWDKDGFLYDPYNVPGVFYKKNGSLLFSKVDDTHIGEYTCTPFNELGTDGPSAPMMVTVLKPPAFTITPNNLYIKNKGERVDIYCDAKDGPNGHRPIIVWYRKDGLPLPDDSRYVDNNGNLTIFDVRKEDEGLYVCSVSNSVASITTETELFVDNMPLGIPEHVEGFPSERSVFLRWEKCKNRNNVSYSIWYKTALSAEWKTYQVPAYRYEATIDNLLPGKEYEFMVLCEDPLNERLFSKTIKTRTNPTIGQLPSDINGYLPPIGFPTNVTVTPTNNGYMLSWHPPTHGLDRLKFYVVRIIQESGEFYASLETRNTSLYLTNLPEGNEYKIQVISVTLDDDQAISESVVLNVPQYRRVQAVSTGIIAGLALAMVVIAAGYYVRGKWCKKHSKEIYITYEKPKI